MNNNESIIHHLAMHIIALYSNYKYNHFLINYLLLLYGVNEIDLDLFICRSKQHIKDYKNYIYFTSNYMVYVFGNKKIRITNRTIINVCKLLLDKQDVYKVINVNDIHAYIRCITPNKMSSRDVFTAVVNELYVSGNIVAIDKLCENRGISLDSCITDYIEPSNI